jgi:hypothetical protein
MSAVVRDRLITIAILLTSSAFFTFSAAAAVGTRPQVDLSLEVTTNPVPFVPGGRGTVTLTVHNAGPDTAGATIPNFDTIVVFQNEFIITTQPPPFWLLTQGVGCIIDTYLSDPLPNGDIALVYIFYVDPIAAGESRVCTYDIEFYPSTRDSFATHWFVTSSNDDDTDPGNNRVDYVFQAPAASIPTASRHGLIALGFCLLLTGWIWRGRMSWFSRSKR